MKFNNNILQQNNHKENLIEFLDSLSNEFDYAILHHAHRIFSGRDDIDLIVNCSKIEIQNYIKKFVQDKGYLLGSYYTIDKSIYRFDIFYYFNNKLFKIELDCACKGNKSDLLGINTTKLLKNKVIINVDGYDCFKVNNQSEIEYYIKKKAFKKNEIKPHVHYLKSLDPELTEDGIIDRYNVWQNYFSSFLFKLKFVKNKISLLTHRINEKPSVTICFLGPDGSGKSTIINKLQKEKLFINNYYFHLKPLIVDNANTKNVVANPHDKPVYSGFKSYLKLLYFIFEYNLGWIKNIWPLKIKSSLIIFDRYYDDIFVDYKRYRFGGKVVFAKLVKKIIPKPDIYFILTADAQVIYNRKKEVTFDELERQISGYNELSDQKKYYRIDVDKTPNEITKEIILILMSKLNE